MYEGKKDHISLILPGSETDNGNNSLQNTLIRRSLRRYWNQLPRCQRNLIILTIVAVCIMLLMFLPGDQVIPSDSGKDFNHINIAPFKDEHILNENFASDLKKTGESMKPSISKTAEKSIQHEMKKGNENDQVSADKTSVLGKEHESLNEIDSVVEEPKEGENRLVSYLKGRQKEENKSLPVYENGLEVVNGDVYPIKFKGPRNERQKAVVEAFQHSWRGYKEYAWGHDNLKPISMGLHDWFGLGLTIVDSLDTMYIMDLQEEFDEARNWVETYLQFDINRDVNLFEVTIRVLGGLLSAYHLSGDKMFLQKSVDLGNRLLPCFDSPSGIPYSDINLATMNAHSPKWSPDSSTSEVTTIQLEFRDLTRITGNSIYEEVVHKVNEKVHSLEKENGLVPIFINANTGLFRHYSTISLGARGDSYYEYLLKQWLQTGRNKNDFLIADYKKAIEGVLTRLVRKTPKEHHTYIGELINGKDFKPKMDHLTCYLPGTLLLGHKYGMPESHLNLAKELLETCYQTYMKQPTGLAPEITYFNLEDNGESDIQVKTNDAHNLLRPEFIESLYYFYVITGDKDYQDKGWNILQSFEKYTKVKHGYTSIGNVKNVLNTRPRDMMESFWLGETLKYLYLLFSDDRNEIDLEKFIFNTEAHPLPARKELGNNVDDQND